MAETKSAEITSRPPLIELAPDKASTPALVYIGRDDRLYLHSVSILSARAVRIAGRLLHADGLIRPFRFDAAVPAATPTVQTFELAEGYLLSLTCRTTTAGTETGTIFAEIGLLRGRVADQERAQLLCSGKPSPVAPIGWPFGKQELSTDGDGFLRQLATADPAAGAEWTTTIPANIRALVRSIRFQLVTDATVANRFPRVEYVQGGVVVWRSHPNAAQTASQTRDYNYALGTDFIDAVAELENQNQLPALPLESSTIFRSSTSGIVAGDNYGAAQFVMEQWLSE